MADKVGFRSVAEWVHGDKQIKAVVVSAGGKTETGKKVTDLLLDASKQISSGKAVNKALMPFIERVLSDAEELSLGKYIQDELMTVGQEVEKDPSLDFLLSRGEYFYAKLFAAYCGLPFVDSSELIGFYGNGELNLGLCEYQAAKAFTEVGRFVCGGFYGALPNGKIKIFSRGGSDFSGAIIARGLRAEEYLNFTDVDGIFPFNPKERQSDMIEEISFDTVRLLGEFGATVLHPASVLPLYGTGAKILLKNTFNKYSRGTAIIENSQNKPFAMAYRKNCRYLKITQREKGYRLLRGLENQPAKIIYSVSSKDCLEVCVEGEFEGKIDGLQRKENVFVIYLTPCQRSYEVINAIRKEHMSIFTCVFSGGAYLAVEEARVEQALLTVYENA